MKKDKPIVAVLMGSFSDRPVMKEAMAILERFGIPYEEKVISAHRSPKLAFKFATGAEEKGLEVIIAGAGKAAHLAGVIASLTIIPVIGVPIPTRDLGGLDSLLSIVQMPPGVPVAAVAIGGAKNAGILAAKIVARHHSEVKEKLRAFKEELAEEVRKQQESMGKS